MVRPFIKIFCVASVLSMPVSGRPALEGERLRMDPGSASGR